jgi:hypothetical protein
VALTVGELAVELEAKTRDFDARITAAERRLGTFQKTAEARTAGISAAFGRLRSSAGTLAAGFGAFAAVLGVGGIANAARAAAEEMDRIGDTADRLGLTTSALQELEFAAAKADVTAETLAGSLQFLARGIAEARAGQGRLRTFLTNTNPALLEQLKATTDLDAAFQLATKAIAGASNQQEALALGASFFGRSAGPRLVNVALEGADAFDKLRQRARDAGVVLDEDLIRSAGETADELALLSRVIKANLNQAFLAAAPLLTSLSEEFAEAAQGVSLFFDIFREAGQQSTRNLEIQLGILLEKLERAQARFRQLGGERAVRVATDVGLPAPELRGEAGRAQREIAALEARIGQLQGVLRQREQTRPPAGGGAGATDFAAAEAARKKAEEDAKKLADEQARSLERLVELRRALTLEILAEQEPLRAEVQAIDDQIADVRALAVDAAGRAQAEAHVNDLLERRADLQQRLNDATFDQRVGLEELEEKLRTLTDLDRERAQALRDQLFARLAEAEGAEALAEALRDAIRRVDQDIEDETQELAIDVGEAIGEGVAGGIRQALKDVARGDVPEFADVLGNLSETFLGTAIDTALAGLEDKLEKTFEGLADAVGGLFGQAGNEQFRGAFAGALGIGLSLAQGALRDTEADVRHEAIRSAVTSTQEVRGIVAGPTEIPIFQVGKTIEASFVPVVDLLAQGNAILRAIQKAVEIQGPEATISAAALLERASASLANTTSPTLA